MSNFFSRKEVCMHKHIGKYHNRSHDTHNDLWLHFVQDVASLAAFIESGVACYKNVFAGPPYFENYDGQEETFIKPMFADFATAGVLVFLTTSDNPIKSEMIGF